MPKPIRPSRRIRPIGLIGLGLMGSAIAERLLAVGFTVVGWDISAEARKRFTKLGGQSATIAASSSFSFGRGGYLEQLAAG